MHRSITDYILVTKKLPPQVEDKRVHCIYDFSSHCFILISKINLVTRWTSTKKRFNSTQRIRAAAHQLRQDKHQDMWTKETKADVSIVTQTGVRRFA
jgi:hypothetical protein